MNLQQLHLPEPWPCPSSLVPVLPAPPSQHVRVRYADPAHTRTLLSALARLNHSQPLLAAKAGQAVVAPADSYTASSGGGGCPADLTLCTDAQLQGERGKEARVWG